MMCSGNFRILIQKCTLPIPYLLPFLEGRAGNGGRHCLLHSRTLFINETVCSTLDAVTVPNYGTYRKEFPNLHYNDPPPSNRVLVILFTSEEPFPSLPEDQKKIVRTLRINGCVAEIL